MTRKDVYVYQWPGKLNVLVLSIVHLLSSLYILFQRKILPWQIFDILLRVGDLVGHRKTFSLSYATTLYIFRSAGTHVYTCLVVRIYLRALSFSRWTTTPRCWIPCLDSASSNNSNSSKSNNNHPNDQIQAAITPRIDHHYNDGNANSHHHHHHQH